MLLGKVQLNVIIDYLFFVLFGLTYSYACYLSPFPPGLQNRDIPQDGGFFTEQRSGRRGRRHKGQHKLVDGKYRAVKPDMENSDPGHPRFGKISHGDGGM